MIIVKVLWGENYGVLQNEATNSLKYVKDFDFVKISPEIFEFLLNNRNETFVIRIDVLDKNIIEDNSNVKSITSSKSQEITYIKPLKSLVRNKKTEEELQEDLSDDDFDNDIEDYDANEEIEDNIEKNEEQDEVIPETSEIEEAFMIDSGKYCSNITNVQLISIGLNV